MASTKDSKGSGMNQAITPDAQEVRGRSGMPHPPYGEGMGGPVGTGKGAAKAPAKRAMPSKSGRRR